MITSAIFWALQFSQVTLAAPPSPAVKCEQALLETGRMIDRIFANSFIDPDGFGPESGLGQDTQVVLRSEAEVLRFLADKARTARLITPTLDALRSLTTRDFINREYVVSSLGLSQWPIRRDRFNEVTLNDWLAMQERFAKISPTSQDEWESDLLDSEAGIPGIHPTMNAELKLSLKMANRARQWVTDPLARNVFIYLEDGGGGLGYGKKTLPELFRVALEKDSICTLGTDEKSIKEAASFGECDPEHSMRKMVLPFYLSKNENLKISEANLKHILAIAARYTHLRQMVWGANRRQLTDDQALLLAVFPELTGFVLADEEQSLSLNSFGGQAIAISSRYKFGLGEKESFWWDLANPRWLKPELAAIGVGDLHFNMRIVRYYDHREQELGPMEFRVTMTPFSSSGNYMELTDLQTQQIVEILQRNLKKYSNSTSMLKIELLAPTEQVQKNGYIYGVSVDGRELETFTRLSELSFVWSMLTAP